MTSSPILPGTWSEWITQVADADGLRESGAIIRMANRYAVGAGMSCESAVGMLSWLGSVAMLNYTSVSWESGIWHPSAVTIAVVETDDVPIDSVTSGFIKMVSQLGIDPIQDTVKEGPSGLITRLESARSKPLLEFEDRFDPTSEVSARDIASSDTSKIDAQRADNIGNVRGLIYPSGRAFMSYLYDTPFFNALDELIQHGSLHIKGKHETHVLHNMNVAAFLPFYQGALANLFQSSNVQTNMNLLLRQLLVLWPTPNQNSSRRNIGQAIDEIKVAATTGIKSLEALMPTYLDSRHFDFIHEPMFDTGVGVRYVSINRLERMTRLAVSVAFWRIAEGSTNFILTDADYAVAEGILHAHEMGSRIVEIATSKGRLGYEALKIFVSLTEKHGPSTLAAAIAQMSDAKLTDSVLTLLFNHDILTTDGGLTDSYRLVKGPVITEHKRRWNY